MENKNNHPSPLECLPIDIIGEIAQHLIKKPRALLSLRQTSKTCYGFCERVNLKVKLTPTYSQNMSIIKYVRYCRTSNPVKQYALVFLEWIRDSCGDCVVQKGGILVESNERTSSLIQVISDITDFICVLHAYNPSFGCSVLKTRVIPMHIYLREDEVNVRQILNFIDSEVRRLSHGMASKLPKITDLFPIDLFLLKEKSYVPSNYYRVGFRISSPTKIYGFPCVEYPVSPRKNSFFLPFH